MDKKIVPSSTICFVAGRSGGHITPALTLAQREKLHNQATTVMLFTTATKLDYDIVATSDAIDMHMPLALDNIPYKKLRQWPKFLYQFIKTSIKSFRALRKHRPTKIVSMGGYIALPVCLAGTLLRIPIEIVELNAEPGLATTWLAPLATTINVCFEETKKHFSSYQCVAISYPIRFNQEYQNIDKQTAQARLYVPHNRFVILILGGSQGSSFINKAIHHWLEQRCQEERALIYLLHQIGTHEDREAWIIWYTNCGILAHVFTYNHDMAPLYAGADMVICRSGAGSLFETLFFNKPCITIPLETETNKHQVANALAISNDHPELFTVVRQDKVAAQLGLAISSKYKELTKQQNNYTYPTETVTITNYGK